MFHTTSPNARQLSQSMHPRAPVSAVTFHVSVQSPLTGTPILLGASPVINLRQIPIEGAHIQSINSEGAFAVHTFDAEQNGEPPTIRYIAFTISTEALWQRNIDHLRQSLWTPPNIPQNIFQYALSFQTEIIQSENAHRQGQERDTNTQNADEGGENQIPHTVVITGGLFESALEDTLEGIQDDDEDDTM